LKEQVTASTKTGNVGIPRRRQVSRTERIHIPSDFVVERLPLIENLLR